MNIQPPFIHVRNVTKAYHKGDESIPVLSGLDLEIQQGEFVALMGPSGSGKSTLLNLLGGLDSVDQGNLSISGQSMGGLSDAQLTRWRATSVGFIFQSYNLLPGLNALQNVELPLLLSKYNAGQRRKRAQIALDVVGMLERADHLPSELSGGQEQRVAIARALVTNPPLLLADEPTGDLDRNTADEVLRLLQALNSRQGKTIVMVTHDAKAAQAANRVVVMDKGQLVPVHSSEFAAVVNG